MEAHIAACADCRRDVQLLQPTVDSVAAWPMDSLSTPARLWGRLVRRIADESGVEPISTPGDECAEPADPADPEWEDVAPGIACQLLSTDTERKTVCMLVRLAPGGEYPPHTHGGIEELHLLDGELWIDGAKLCPGDYNRREPGTSDARVWSETGCTCVLITSTADVLH